MKLTNEEILTLAKAHRLASPYAVQNLASDGTDPLLLSKGAGSVHLLRRRTEDGWVNLGFAVWSCRRAGWVCGSWNRPQDFASAADYLVNMAWEG